jgi:hypothetical protein
LPDLYWFLSKLSILNDFVASEAQGEGWLKIARLLHE